MINCVYVPTTMSRSRCLHFGRGTVEHAFRIVHSTELNRVFAPAAFRLNILYSRDVGFQASEVRLGTVSLALQKPLVALGEGSAV